MSNKVYDILKWVVITVCPALATLITGLGLLYGFDSSVIVGTLTLITTFAGTLLGVSSVKYAKSVEMEKEADE